MTERRSIEDDLVKELRKYARKHSQGIAAETLRQTLETKGHKKEEIRAALQRALNKGQVRLGRELRLEAA